LRLLQEYQQIRDSIYNLITVASPAVTNGTARANKYYSHIPSTIVYPVNYRNFISLDMTVGGITSYSMPTTFNELGPLLEDSFKHPTNERTRYIENSTGRTIWRGPTGTLTAGLTYLRVPTPYSLSDESKTLTNGQVLTNTLVYYALETSVYSGTTYEAGDSITGSGAALASGLVILSTLTSPIDLPSPVHEEICKLASSKLLATIQMVDQSLVIEKEASKPI